MSRPPRHQRPERNHWAGDGSPAAWEFTAAESVKAGPVPVVTSMQHVAAGHSGRPVRPQPVRPHHAAHRVGRAARSCPSNPSIMR